MQKQPPLPIYGVHLYRSACLFLFTDVINSPNLVNNLHFFSKYVIDMSKGDTFIFDLYMVNPICNADFELTFHA
jgi:hypothetical protein